MAVKMERERDREIERERGTSKQPVYSSYVRDHSVCADDVVNSLVKRHKLFIMRQDFDDQLQVRHGLVVGLLIV